MLLAEGFHTYLGLPLISKGEVLGVLEIMRRVPRDFDQDWLDFVEALAGQVAIAINNAEMYEKLQRTYDEVIKALDDTLDGWSRALDSRNLANSGHSQRVVWWTLALGRALGVPDNELIHLRRGARLHDIGKLALPDSILKKPGPLTEEERTLMRKHPVYAFEWLSPIFYLQPALDIPYCHHEAWDGSGYPRGLKGHEIPLPGRIFAIVDAWDSLRSDRPFRKAWPREKALEYIREMAGKLYDPEIVSVFLQLVDSEPEGFMMNGAE
jgi:HD-GYP domain-containing protein (c-di-GMP phosphodiesterase class II)